jgi:hypothetical protein
MKDLSLSTRLPNSWHLAPEKRDQPLQQVGSSVSKFTEGGHNCPDSLRLWLYTVMETVSLTFSINRWMDIGQRGCSILSGLLQQVCEQGYQSSLVCAVAGQAFTPLNSGWIIKVEQWMMSFQSRVCWETLLFRWFGVLVLFLLYSLWPVWLV